MFGKLLVYLAVFATAVPSMAAEREVRFNRDVRPMLTHGSQEAWSVVNRSDDLGVNLGQQPDQPLTEQHGVIGHHHTHAPYRPTPSARLSDGHSRLRV